MQPEYRYSHHTPPTKDCVPELYRDTENRVSIYTDYELVRRHETYDEYTAVCVELRTSRGNLIVYGTIMGIRGNREKSYMWDLAAQMEDIRRLSALGDIIAVSQRFLAGAEITVDEWNRDKALSDHKGIVAEIIWKREGLWSG